ncbi:MAG: hypothetical protein WD492_03160 [Alkalispirochaeta sp.]
MKTQKKAGTHYRPFEFLGDRHASTRLPGINYLHRNAAANETSELLTGVLPLRSALPVRGNFTQHHSPPKSPPIGDPYIYNLVLLEVKVKQNHKVFQRTPSSSA